MSGPDEYDELLPRIIAKLDEINERAEERGEQPDWTEAADLVNEMMEVIRTAPMRLSIFVRLRNVAGEEKTVLAHGETSEEAVFYAERRMHTWTQDDTWTTEKWWFA